MPQPIRVLVVDDSALIRRQLRRIVDEAPGLVLADTARDGEDALEKMRRLRPDVVTLDVNLPVMDGLTVLRTAMEEEICPVVMLSSLTTKGSDTALQAMEAGAFDCIGKPDGTASATMDLVGARIVAAVEAAARPGVLARLTRRLRRPPTPRLPASRPPTMPSIRGSRAVVIGVSTGGPRNLLDVLPQLPADLDAPVFIAQHMPASFTGPFARRLDSLCDIHVVEGQPGQKVRPGTCYVAPGGRQMTLLKRADGEIVVRTPATPTTQFMPSVDVLADAVRAIYGRHTLGVIMTGMGSDGSRAMERLHAEGGRVVVESEETATVFGMPGAVVRLRVADAVAPSYELADHITRWVNGR